MHVRMRMNRMPTFLSYLLLDLLALGRCSPLMGCISVMVFLDRKDLGFLRFQRDLSEVYIEDLAIEAYSD